MNNQPDSDAVSWDELAQSIADGEAVLVLGPDALPFYPVGDTRDAPQSFSEPNSDFAAPSLLLA